MTATPTSPEDDPASPEIRRINTADLFQGSREIILLHNGEDYRLRLTRADKLILTK